MMGCRTGGMGDDLSSPFPRRLFDVELGCEEEEAVFRYANPGLGSIGGPEDMMDVPGSVAFSSCELPSTPTSLPEPLSPASPLQADCV